MMIRLLLYISCLVFPFQAFAQPPDGGRLLLGIEAARNFTYLLNSHGNLTGVHIEPLGQYHITPNFMLTASAGYSGIHKNVVYKNLYDYSNEGFYLKPGAEIHILRTVTAGISYHHSNFTEKGTFRQHGNYYGNVIIPYESTTSLNMIETNLNYYLNLFTKKLYLKGSVKGAMAFPGQEDILRTVPIYYIPGQGRNFSGLSLGTSVYLLIRL